MPNIPVRFSDLDLSFLPHPVTGQPKVLTDAKAIEQSMRNLVLTNFYERFYYPDIGCDVESQLFEHFGSAFKTITELKIRRGLSNDEPRGRVLRLDIAPDEDRNTVKVAVTYQALNRSEPVVVQFFLEKVR
jgi:phage baseplate assembly protein W